MIGDIIKKGTTHRSPQSFSKKFILTHNVILNGNNIIIISQMYGEDKSKYG